MKIETLIEKFLSVWISEPVNCDSKTCKWWHKDLWWRCHGL